jgi:hypothetical protein
MYILQQESEEFGCRQFAILSPKEFCPGGWQRSTRETILGCPTLYHPLSRCSERTDIRTDREKV